MSRAYKTLSVLGWLSGAAAFVFAGIAMLPEYIVLSILCFLVAALAVAASIFMRGKLLSVKKKRITPLAIICYAIVTGVFIALIFKSSYNMIVIMFGIAIILNIAANLTGAARKA